MKRTISITILYSILLFSSSCSSSMEEDSVKMAELQCENMQITMGGAVKALGNEMNLTEIQTHQEKLQKFSNKMMEKYDGFDEKLKFAEMTRNKLLEICM